VRLHTDSLEVKIECVSEILGGSRFAISSEY